MLPKIALPTFTTTIPSSQTLLTMRPMVVREEKVLLMAKQSDQLTDKYKAIAQVLNACIIQPTIDITKYPLYDLEYLFLKLRIASVSNTTKVSYIDNEDEQTYTFDINLDQVELVNQTTTIPTIKITEEIGFTLQHPAICAYIDQPLTDLNDQQIFDLMIRSSIKKIYDGDIVYEPQTAPKEELDDFINNIPAKSFMEIQQFLGDVPHLEYKVNYKNSVGTEREIVLRTLNDFFTL